MRRSVFTVLWMVWGMLLPAQPGLSATPEKTRELLEKYPKEELSVIKEGDHCEGLFVLDSCYSLDWSAGDSSWVKARGSFYSYDAEGKILQAESRYPSGTSWRPGGRTLYFYNVRDHLISQLFLSYNSSTQSWDTTKQYLRDYSAEGHLMKTVVQYFDQGTWEDKTLSSYDYNADGQRIMYSVSYRDPTGTGWIPQYRFLYTWQGDLQTEDVKQNYDTASEGWINDYRQHYLFDPQNRLTSKTISNWDTVTGDWQNSSLIAYTYDDYGRLVQKLYQRWSSGLWNNTVRYLYAYDKPDTTLILFQVWYANDSTWQDNYRYIYGYDGCGNLISETGIMWDGPSGQWINDYRVVYFVSALPAGHPLTVEIIDSGNVTCYGYHNGWALATASGGTPPYTWLWDNDPPSTDSVATGLSPWRWYHVTVIDSLGNTAIDSVFLTEPEPVTTGTIRGPVNICLDRYYCYCVVPPQDGYYLWTAIGGEIQGYPSGPHATVKWTRPGADTLAVVRYSVNGCPGDTAILVVNTLTVSAPETPATTLTIRPNPASDFIHIDNNTMMPFSYRLTELSGRPVKTGRSGGGLEEVLPVAGLAPGIYLLEIHTQDGHFVIKKVVIR